MKFYLSIFALLFIAGVLSASPGDVLGSPFQLPGTAAGTVRGLDKDWNDGNIWAVTAVTNACQIGKFNAVTHTMVQNWVTTSPSPYWCFDCGYGYVDGGTRYIILTDINSPALRVYQPITGVYIGSLPDAFSAGYHLGVGVQAGPEAPSGNNLYCTNYYYQDIARSDYPCTMWSRNWANITGAPVMGCAYAWGHVIAATSGTDNKLYCFDGILGTLENIWPLSTTSTMIGISAGRADAVGNNESIFMACIDGANIGINEIEIGDIYTPSRVQPASLGTIRGAYR